MANNTHDLGTLYNALTAGSKIIGTIEAESNIRIDGILEGDIRCSSRVVIGQTGVVKGTITCQNAEVMGQVDGRLTVSDTLALRSTAKVKGEITTAILIIEPKATFNGTCEMK